MNAARDAWLRWYWLWDALFAIVSVAIAVIIVTDGVGGPLRRWAAVGVLALMAAWYAGYGRPAITEEVSAGQDRGRIFAAGLVLLLMAAVALQGGASFALFAVCPLLFMSLALREAVAAVVLVNLLPVLAALVEDGTGGLLAVLGPGTVFTTAFGVMVGVWVHQIVSQSEQRADLIRELERSREEVGRLSREAGVAAERSRLAAEIHDTLAQGFTSLVTLVQAAESELDHDTDKARGHLALAARTARENLGEARALVAGLMPSALGTGSLDEAIIRQVERLAEETGVRCDHRFTGDLAELPTGLEVVLLRAVQEALTNVRRHSGARHVRVSLDVTEATVALRVTDDGRGFDPDPATEGFGLRGMRARAEQVGGRLAVHSGAGGTTLELEVPR
ncbi:hypothetical protein BU204_09625 [Actinophytocola xanthii]|uniref:Histidine kinase domain-containing protein n=2 Tax=Actinophytocola xanthii TaxID=1912961 RepID=A0A1Q8CTS4_9PSEU|nr:hypothetical protein BU204_09625 [Actinophytocola xanthii]